MINRNIFIKNKHKKTYYLFIFISILLIIFIISSIYSSKYYEIFNVNENKKNFYIVPKDKQGKIITNSEIKILDYNYNLEKKIEKNYNKYDFSIQLYASSNYNNILEKRNNLAKNLSFNAIDLLIVALNHNLGIDYLLVYRNFKTRNGALNYCSKYLNFIENCLIINLQNLD